MWEKNLLRLFIEVTCFQLSGVGISFVFNQANTDLLMFVLQGLENLEKVPL